MTTLFTLILIVGLAGIWFFTKKNPDKSKRNISIIVSIVSFLGFGIFTELNKKSDDKEIVFTETTSTSSIYSSSEEIKTTETISTETIQESSSTEQKKVENKYVEANKQMADDLQLSLGWALGKLDADGNPTENGTPNEGFNWAIFVTKIELSEEDEQLNVYVTPEFKTLPKEEKQNIVRYAQNQSILFTDDNKRLFTVIYDGTNQIGRSTILDTSEFKFDK
ncbi:hypothetical protein [Vagococcus fluvialis]|uniref:hypothetical protein n=1 Tax=Vagococcus fluvialis TaxID=2738 RepID=UPI00379CAB3D